MPLTLSSVFEFLPLNLWRYLKRFATKDDTIISDLPFKISTKYTPALLFVMICLSFANQFVRNVDIDCVATTVTAASEMGRAIHGHSHPAGDADLNDYCWNYDTFLVAKALDPKMRAVVTYPGVSAYNKATDELLRQHYYKQVWLLLGYCMVIAFLPQFFWKAYAIQKMKILVGPIGAKLKIDPVSQTGQRVSSFLDGVGFNAPFAYYYIFCKIFATVTPFLQLCILCAFIGRRFKNYGIEIVAHVMDDSGPWPNPMDALFPKMAKCEWSRFGYGGDMELRSAQCQLPMNNLTQWSLLVFWWWIVLVTVLNVFSWFHLLIFAAFPPCRRKQYRNYVKSACPKDVETAIHLSTNPGNGKVRNGGAIQITPTRNDVIDIHLTFADWLVLSFLEMNIQGGQFRDFVRKLATTENIAVQIKQIAIPMDTTLPAPNYAPSCPTEKKVSAKIAAPTAVLAPPGHHKTANMAQYGFVQPQSILKGKAPAKESSLARYNSAYEPETAEFERKKALAMAALSDSDELSDFEGLNAEQIPPNLLAMMLAMEQQLPMQSPPKRRANSSDGKPYRSNNHNR